MKKIKIAHIADLHFDTPFKDVSEIQSKINKEELKEVFMKIIHFIKQNSVDILLLAGDIFDNMTINRDTLAFIEKAFIEIKDTRVFISPGNHDPYGSKSFYGLISFPENVYVFKGEIEKVYIKELNANVWGAGFRDRFERKSLISEIPELTDQINIMVIHGEISRGTDSNEYNPITIEQIKNSKMDYIALGHRHNFSGIKKEGSTSYAYCGCPQGRGFDELGDKGIIYGYVYKGAVDLDFVKTSKRNYLEKEVDVSNAFGYIELKEIILNSISEEERKQNFYKLILKGEISGDFNIDESILNKKIQQDFYYCKVIDKTIVKYDIEELTKGYSIKGIFANKLMKKLENAENDEEKEIFKLALKFGLSSLSEGEVRMDDY